VQSPVLTGFVEQVNGTSALTLRSGAPAEELARADDGEGGHRLHSVGGMSFSALVSRNLPACCGGKPFSLGWLKLELTSTSFCEGVVVPDWNQPACSVTLAFCNNCQLALAFARINARPGGLLLNTRIICMQQ